MYPPLYGVYLSKRIVGKVKNTDSSIYLLYTGVSFTHIYPGIVDIIEIEFKKSKKERKKNSFCLLILYITFINTQRSYFSSLLLLYFLVFCLVLSLWGDSVVMRREPQ
jgi:hypothetical protein